MYHHFEKLLTSICYSIDTWTWLLNLFCFKVVCQENVKGVSVMHRLLVAEDMLMNLEQQ